MKSRFGMSKKGGMPPMEMDNDGDGAPIKGKKPFIFAKKDGKSAKTGSPIGKKSVSPAKAKGKMNSNLAAASRKVDQKAPKKPTGGD